MSEGKTQSLQIRQTSIDFSGISQIPVVWEEEAKPSPWQINSQVFLWGKLLWVISSVS